MKSFRSNRHVQDLSHRRAVIAEQMHIYEALEAAVERRGEVFAVIETSVDTEKAQQELQALLGTDELGARAVLDLQLRRLSLAERAFIAERLRELREIDDYA
ncbi:MAG: hypothetical protein WKF82_11365 [Nocardioidaceae bacterium]